MKTKRVLLITASALLCGAALAALLRYELPAGLTERAAHMPGMGTSIPPRLVWNPNETVTGNILAANFAQNQRDWPRVEQYMAHIGAALEDDDLMRLRLMLLALGAGQFDRAVHFANTVNDAPPPKNQAEAEIVTDGRNMASLILMANAVRAGEFEEAAKHLDALTAPPLKALLGHVLSGWLDAAAGKIISSNVHDMAFLPALHRGLAAEWAGQIDTASAIFDSIAAAPLTPEAVQIIAAYNLRHNRTEQALVALRDGRERYPQEHDIEAMLEALDAGKTPELKPEWAFHMQGATAGIAQALRDLAHFMSTEKSWDSALIFAQMGRMIRSDVPRLDLLIGTVFQEENRTDEARITFAAIPKDSPEYIDAQIRLAELDAGQGNNDAAVRNLEKLLSAHPAPRIAYALGELHRANQDYAAAIRAYDRTIDLSGGSADDGLWSVYFVRAMAHDQLDNWPKAEADLKTALDYRPDNPHVLNYLGYSYADRGLQLDVAKNMIIKALTQQPLDPYTIDSLGWVYYKEGDYAQALLFIERAVSLKPYDPVMNDHLGDLYAKTGRMLEAHYQWRRALSYADEKREAKLIRELENKLSGNMPD